jgi:recombination endonuclease VII
VCTGCDKEQPESEYYRRSDTGKLRRRCKACHSVRTISSHRRRRYGLEPAEYEQMYEEQGGLCAICRSRPIVVVDHDHETEEVRALLCRTCNLVVGFSFEDPAVLRAAADYIEKWLPEYLAGRR